MVSTRRQAATEQVSLSSQGAEGRNNVDHASTPSSSTTTQRISSQRNGRGTAGLALQDSVPKARRVRSTRATTSTSASTSHLSDSMSGETPPDPCGDSEGGPSGSKGASGEGSSEPPSASKLIVFKPPPKRRKTRHQWSTKKRKESAATREARKAFLCSFMELPQDIVLEVESMVLMFSHLPPKGLLAISRTSKQFRSMMLSKRYTDIWRNSRAEFVVPVPDPPEGLSEPRWAALLFDTNCQICGVSVKGGAEINWYFMRRTCQSCLIRRTVTLPLPSTDYRSTSGMLRSVDIEMMQYIPRGGLSGVFRSLDPGAEARYWESDAIKVLQKWQELAARNDSTGRSALYEWKVRRRETIRKNLSMIPTYRLWRANVAYPSKRLIKHKEERMLHETRYRQVEETKDRLRTAGYKMQDIEMSILLTYPPYNSSSPWLRLSESDWETNHPMFEDEVKWHRDFRLSFEKQLFTQERLLLFEDVYQNYLGTLRPSERYTCPPSCALRSVPFIASILERNHRADITQAHFEPIADKMKDAIDAAQQGLKSSLNRAACFTFGLEDPWLLASNVYQRASKPDPTFPIDPEDRVIVGWDMIATHSVMGHSKVWSSPAIFAEVPKPFRANATVFREADRLLTMARLPRETTLATMDERDLRFVCDACHGRVRVFTWRAALCHIDLYGIRNHKMRLAKPREARAAKDNEGPAREQTKAWSCNHCLQFLEIANATTKSAILGHLADEHGIANPQTPEDYFVNQRCRLAYEVPYLYKPKGEAHAPRQQTRAKSAKR
ncbi:hypothetical protein NMY22_g12655 [Coprinellus aureogranulatus]|nr:hypothetical protein NMY22_g12655 [Coprinellus aureogranulatus]